MTFFVVCLIWIENLTWSSDFVIHGEERGAHDASTPLWTPSPYHRQDALSEDLRARALRGGPEISMESSLPSRNLREETKEADPERLPEQQDQQQNPKKIGKAASSSEYSSMHIVFSTGCTRYQDWQSYALLHSLQTAGYQGEVTRIVSGCSSAERSKEARTLFQTLTHDVLDCGASCHWHETPDFSRIQSDTKHSPSSSSEPTSYHFFNKPLGLRHWMIEYESSHLGSGISPSESEQTIVILDPDQIVMRNFQVDFESVRVGHPIAAKYGFGGRWISEAFDFSSPPIRGIDHDKVNHRTLEALKSVTSQLTPREVRLLYAAGPPYIAKAADMYRLVHTWAEFVIPVYQYLRSPDPFMAEMYSFSLAAAYLDLPHTLSTSLMASNPNSGVERPAWIAWVDERPIEPKICPAAVASDAEVAHLPYTLHYCQQYSVGSSMFDKAWLPTNFFSCEHPLFKEISSSNTLELFTPNINNPSANTKTRVEHRSAIFLCHLLSKLNNAAILYKQKTCSAASNMGPEQHSKTAMSNTNFAKTFILAHPRW